MGNHHQIRLHLAGGSWAAFQRTRERVSTFTPSRRDFRAFQSPDRSHGAQRRCYLPCWLRLSRRALSAHIIQKIAFAQLTVSIAGGQNAWLRKGDLDTTLALLCRGAHFDRALYVSLAVGLDLSDRALAERQGFGDLYEDAYRYGQRNAPSGSGKFAPLDGDVTPARNLIRFAECNVSFCTRQFRTSAANIVFSVRDRPIHAPTEFLQCLSYAAQPAQHMTVQSHFIDAARIGVDREEDIAANRPWAGMMQIAQRAPPAVDAARPRARHRFPISGSVIPG